jgi:hypothetical protein
MRKSGLEIKTKNSKINLFKKISDYMFKLTGYFIDRVPMDKNVSTDNKVAYGRFD